MKNSYFHLLAIFLHRYFLVSALLIYVLVPALRSDRQAVYIEWALLVIGGWTCGLYVEVVASSTMMAVWPGARRKLFITASGLVLLFLLFDVAVFHGERVHFFEDIALRFLLISAVFLAGYTCAILPTLVLSLPLMALMIMIDYSYPGWAWICYPLGIGCFAIVRRRVLALNEESREFVSPKDLNAMTETRAEEETKYVDRAGWSEGFYDASCADVVIRPHYWNRHPRLARFLRWRATLGPGFNPGMNVWVYMALVPMMVSSFALTATQYQHRLDFQEMILFAIFLFMCWFSPMRRARYLPLELALPVSRRDYVIGMGGMQLIADMTDMALIAFYAVITLALFNRSMMAQSDVWEILALLFCARLLILVLMMLAATFRVRVRFQRWWNSPLFLWILWIAGADWIASADWLNAHTVHFSLPMNAVTLACLAASILLLPLGYRRWLVREI